MKTARPVVAIVGRPNVGKSTLFNKLTGRRLSIVDDTPGVTRDRIYGDCEWLNHNFLLVDTGGIEPRSDDVILSQMRRQASLAIDGADAIVFVTDLKSGIVSTDAEVAEMLQKSGKPIILCVNKSDSLGEPPPEFYEFYNLGLGDPIAVSAVHGHGTGDLLDAVLEHLPAYGEEEDEVFLGRSVTQHKSVSDDTARKIDEVVRGILDRAYERTRQILTENIDKLHAMAKLLLEYETIDVPQIDAIMEGREPPPPMGWVESGKGGDKGGDGDSRPLPPIGGPAEQT